MTGKDLKHLIHALLNDHPNIAVSRAGHATHAERYVSKTGAPIGFEPERARFQNLWVRADSIRRHLFVDIGSVFYDHKDFERSKPNHNLFGEDAFKGCDLIRFQVVKVWQAVRIIQEVAGEANPL